MNKLRSSHGTFMVALVHPSIVRTRFVLVSALWLIAIAGALLLAGCDQPASSSACSPTAAASHDTGGGDHGGGDGGDDNDHSPPRPCEGTYNVLIRGDYQGSGTATVSGNAVQITAQVTDSHGTHGTFSFSGPMVNQRFKGTGSMMESTASVSGRVDSIDNSASRGSILKTNRLVSTVSTSSGHFARIAGEH
jgi:hypothetical protein